MIARRVAAIATAVALAAACDSGPDDGPPAEPVNSSQTPRTLARWACARLDSGQPEADVVPALASRVDRHGVDLRDTLTEVERRCSEHLAP